jgi:hypothetical protein
MMADWLGALVCCDPIADPLPMHAWHELLQSANNLLPGAENPPLVAPIPHWDEFDGPNAVQPRLQNRTWRGRNANPDSFPRFLADGRPAPARAYFAPYASAPDSELRQMIALAPFTPLIDQGDLALTLRGRVRSFAQPNPDETQIVLECMAANGDTLVTLDLGKHAFTDAWHLLAGTILAPVGTRQAQIRLRSIRHSGRNNDGYFDAVQLIPSHRKIAAALRSSFI